MVPSACRFWLRICSSLKSKGTKIPSVWAGSSSVVCWLGKACSPLKLVVFSFLPTSTKDQLFFSLFFLFPPEGRRPSQIPDDFPFSSVEEMKANYLWTNLRLGASQAFARHLVLLRHFDYINLSTREKRYLRRLREAVDELMQAWLTGPLPDVHRGEGKLSEAGKRVAAILG